MAIKVFYDFQTAVDFLNQYKCSRMDYWRAFPYARFGKEIDKVEVVMNSERPESASFHFIRWKKDISTIFFRNRSS